MKKRLNIKKIGLFSVIFIYITSIILLRDVDNLDEIWNFNFARCMANGLIPYRDFNIIQGVFLPWICSIFLKIFGQEMIVTRVLSIILDTTILYLLYIVMSKLKIKEYLKYLTLILFAIIMKEYFTIDYNWLNLLILLIILKLELNEEKTLTLNIRKDFVIGILSGISIITKQTTGILITICTIGYKILAIRKKEEIIEFLKIALIRLIASLIPVLIIVLILIYNNALKDYIDYCIMGISTFTNKVSYLRLLKSKKLVIKILSYLPIINIIVFIMYLKNKDKNLLILFSFSLVNLSVVYPISDESHFVIAIMLTVISTIYLINLIKINVKKEIWMKYFLRCIICICSILSIIMFFLNIKKNNINIELEHFKYLPMSKEDISGVNEITNYIKSQNKKVYILDATAALYMIPIDRYNKNYDMFLKGNLGSKGEDGQIENIKSTSEKIILIMNEKYRRNWQNPEKVREYIQKNMTKKGQIRNFDIYE